MPRPDRRGCPGVLVCFGQPVGSTIGRSDGDAWGGLLDLAVDILAPRVRTSWASVIMMFDGDGGRGRPRPAKRRNSIEYGGFRIDTNEQVGARVRRATSGPEFGTVRARQAPNAPPPHALLGRGSQIEDSRQAVRLHRPIEFVAPCGFGKSTLLRHIAADLGAGFQKPVVYLNVRGESTADLLQRLTRALYPTERPVKATPKQRSRPLTRIRPLLVLDDVAWDAEETEYLLQSLSGCDLVLGSDRPRLGSHGRSQVLPGLSGDAALILLQHDLGRGLTAAELPAAWQIVTTVGGQPLRLRQAAALVRTGGESFAALARMIERDPAVVDRLSIDRLGENGRQVLAVLAFLGGALLPPDLIAIISDIVQIREHLAELEDRGLAEQHEDRFGLPACRTDGYRTLLAGCFDLGGAVRDIVDWLGARDPTSESSLSAVNGVLSLLEFAAERRQWDLVVRLVRVAEPILTLAGRWDRCQQILDIGIQAATTVGDIATEALFHHQHGTLALCLGELESARHHLAHALERRQRLGDQIGADLTRHNLRQLPGPKIPPLPAPRGPRQPTRRSVTVIGLAGTILTLMIILADAILPSPDHHPPPPTGPTTTGTTTISTTTTTTTTGTTTTNTTIRTTTTSTPASGQDGLLPPFLRSPNPISLRGNAGSRETTKEPVYVANPNEEPITLAPSRIQGDPAFTVVNDCAGPLTPTKACKLVLGFKPTKIGKHTGTLVVSDTVGHTSSVELVGTGFVTLTVRLTNEKDEPAQLGTVTDDQGLINCPRIHCEAEISQPNTHLTLTATTCGATCTFLRWIAPKGTNCSTKPICSVTVTQNTTISAQFQ